MWLRWWRWRRKFGPDLTVVGPELPLVNGIADAFAARKWAIVGPTQQAAQLEGSKIFSKEFLRAAQYSDGENVWRV